MPLLIMRRLLGVAAVTGLLLAPLPALAADGPRDPDAWSRAGSQDGLLPVLTEDQYVLVTGGCQSFDVLNRAPEVVEVLYGDFSAMSPDGYVVMEAGQRVRLYTTRADIDYLAYTWDAQDHAGEGEGVAVDQACTVPANERYVTRVYMDLFTRAADEAGLRGWVTALDTGTPRIQVANAITASDEFRTRLVAGVYEQFLGRAPDAVGLADWVAAMRSGVTIAQMESGFVASDEYYAVGGSTDAGWVQILYSDVLRRSASQGEVDLWVDALAGGASRQQVAMGFLLSTEHLSTVVEGYYLSLLGRDVDADGQASWVRVLQGGGRHEAIIGGIIASDEYYGS